MSHRVRAMVEYGVLQDLTQFVVYDVTQRRQTAADFYADDISV
ncbi:hypothetical protein [Cryobacterium roopkundense]|uniref:Uncharacterized protein n=1 Tax=Cryobacterium roopkundense TaxID=1001240 RepID=A0A7W8ZVQ0_9MICO|nr:hypothetical protein [Cryobacterium roopkundense]MBB5641089.1 hypothetical protein [Cryobacterium roopkundense]